MQEYIDCKGESVKFVGKIDGDKPRGQTNKGIAFTFDLLLFKFFFHFRFGIFLRSI